MPTTALRIWNGMKKMEGESNAGFLEERGRAHQGENHRDTNRCDIFAVLALRGGLQPDTVMTIVTMVIAFYFGTQSEGKNNGK